MRKKQKQKIKKEIILLAPIPTYAIINFPSSDIIENIRTDWNLQNNFTVNDLDQRLEQYYLDGNYSKVDLEPKIEHLWFCLIELYKNHVSSTECINKFIEIYNKIVNRYDRVYDYHENKKIFNYKVNLIDIDDKPMLSYFQTNKPKI